MMAQMGRPMMFRPLRSFSFWIRPPTGWLMMALKGYFDDSGDPDDDKQAAFTIGGYLAPIEMWGAFEPAWSAVLTQFDIPYLHMKDLHNRSGVYKKWKEKNDKNNAEVTDMLQGFAGAIAIAKPRGFAITLPAVAIMQFNEAHRQQVDPKAFCLYFLSFLIRQIYPTEDMELVLDRMNGAHAAIEKAKEYAKTKPLDIGPFPTFTPLSTDGSAGAKNVPELQAADFLAWEARKDYELKRPFFESAIPPQPDDPGFHQEQFKWFLKDRSAKSIREGGHPVQIPFEPHRRSYIALDCAAVTAWPILTYRALCALDEARGGVWGSAA
jgi:hypothetical protein